MTFGYLQPFSFKIGPRPGPTGPTVSRIRHGVTEITLSDGRSVRATLHVRSVTSDPKKPGTVGLSYNVITEIINTQDVPVLDVHETVQ